MSISKPSQFIEPSLHRLALLGFRDPDDLTDWGPIRAAQLNAVRERTLFLLAANVIGAALAALVFGETLPIWAVGGWAALIGATSAWVAFRRLRRPPCERAEGEEVRDTLIEGVALGAAWSIAPLALAPAAGVHAMFALWILLAVLMAAAAMAMAALPLATVAFLGVVGLSAAGMLQIAGLPGIMAATVLFTALMIMLCLSRGAALIVLRAREIALAERDETVRMLLRESNEEVGDWLWETDAQRRVIRASPRFAESIGVDARSINGRPFVEVLAGQAWEEGNFAPGLHVLAERLKAREAFRDLLLPVHVDGRDRWWEMTASPRTDERGAFVGFRGVGSDVTERRDADAKIRRMARFDMLTGLPNRTLLGETLGEVMAAAEQWSSRTAFMMIDLDRFKSVNDSLGHPVGDRLLTRVAERLGQMTGQDQMVGRLGGDEFAVVIRDVSDPQAVENLARTIIETLSKPYEVDQHTLYIGASIGIAFSPRDGRTPEMLTRSADLALYRSKDAGGGVFHVYEPELHVAAEERRVLEIALRHAIERGELHLAYQPVVGAGDERLSGFEALLRWTHPTLGPISPAKFIPLAEEARLIAPIGEWVLHTACREAALWPDPVRVAVNVSPEQLYNPAFVTVVAQALAASGLPAGRLELEVTESVFLREGTAAVSTLERILDLGVRLSLDDFGTGYSSLGYLSRTRFSSIKIDRSFVVNAAEGKKEAIAIVRAVVALAGSLDMATTAEGVETDRQLEMVRTLGCSRIQGFYYGRPLPADEARSVAERQHGRAAVA